MTDSKILPAGDISKQLAEDDPAVAEMRVELELLEEQLRTGETPLEFERETALHQGLEIVRQIGREPLFSGDVPQNDDHGDLGVIRDYKLISKLGEGGMGTVYKALHTKLDKVVALKVLPAGTTRNADALARFEREMKAVGKLQHPNIVGAHDAGEANGQHFLVVEMVDGQDLSQISNFHGQLDVADACELVRQAAVGLQEAHEHDMVHRDIKPSNLMLAVKKRKKKTAATVKILDMGLALLAGPHPEGEEITNSGQVMGTIDFMAPEQATDTHTVDIRADIYALGATLYKLLTGASPFQDSRYDSVVKKILAVVSESPPPASARRTGLPPDLVALITRLMAKDKDSRPASPDEVASALAPFAQGHNIAALISKANVQSHAQTSTSAVVGNGVATSPIVESPQFPQPIEPTAVAATVKPSTHRGVSPPWKWIGIASGGLLGVIAIALGVIFFVQTPDGATVRVEVNDPQLEVTFKGPDIHIKGKNQDINVTAGKQLLEIERGDFSFETDKLVLTDGATTILKIELLPGKVQVVSAGKVIDEKPYGNNVAKDSQTPPAPKLDETSPDARLVAVWLRSLGAKFSTDTSIHEIPITSKAYHDWSSKMPADPGAIEGVDLIVKAEDTANRLGELAAFPRLKMLRLDLQQAEFDTADLSGFQQLKSLEALTVLSKREKVNRIDGTWTRHIAGLKSLKQLFTDYTIMKDSDMVYLDGLHNLEALMLHGTDVTDKGVAMLDSFEKLRWLSLYSTKISDDSLRTVGRLSRLEMLFLQRTDITDDGIEHLRGLQNMNEIFLDGTLVTQAGASKLRSALPKGVHVKVDSLRVRPIPSAAESKE